MPIHPDPHAFDHLVAALHRRARALTNSPENAADLAQDAALRTWQALQSGAEIRALQPYAMTALHNLARSQRRNRRVFEPLSEDSASTQHAGDARLLNEELNCAIARLPAAQADLLKLLQSGETSPTAMAKRTGVPVGTVMSRLARARARLRQELDLPDHGPDPDQV